MSRGDQGAVDSTASAENSTYNTDAENSFANTNADIGDYSTAVGAFQAANPYGTGGAVQTAQNQEAADTSAGQAQAAGQAVQGAAVRTGQNAGGAIAATQDMQQTNERNLVGQEATNTANTAAANAGYGAQVVGDTANIANMQDQLATQQASAAQGALGTEESAAQTPSFLDELGSGLTGMAGTLGAAGIKQCWIAAELWGGWLDPRTMLVRDWLQTEVSRTWYGRIILRAYTRWGRQVAATIHTRKVLRSFFQSIFDRALKAATKWEANRGR